MPYKVAAFYQFAPFPDFRELREPLQAVCARLKLKGSVLLAHEGINGTLAGEPEAIDGIMKLGINNGTQTTNICATRRTNSSSSSCSGAASESIPKKTALDASPNGPAKTCPGGHGASSRKSLHVTSANAGSTVRSKPTTPSAAVESAISRVGPSRQASETGS